MLGRLRSVGGNGHEARREQSGPVAQEQHDLAVVAAEWARTRPQHLTGGQQLVEQAGE